MYQNLRIKKKNQINYFIQSLGIGIVLFIVFFSPNAILTILGYGILATIIFFFFKNIRSIKQLFLDTKELNMVFFDKKEKRMLYQDVSYRLKPNEILIYFESKKIAVIKKSEWDEFLMIYGVLKKHVKIQGETFKEKAGGLVKEIIKDEIKDPIYSPED